MKKLTVLIGTFLLLVSFVSAQTYITKKTDIFGNKTTVIKDQYGNTIGTATTEKTDIFGNKKTVVKDIYGNPIK